jgi:hypothetical protein
MSRIFFYITIGVVIGIQCGRRTQPQTTLTTEYYLQFDLVHLTPLQQVSVAPQTPHVRVLRSSSGIDSLEIYMFAAGQKKMNQSLVRINWKGFAKIYAGKSRRYGCTTVDTFISVGNRLFEFRNCYGIGKPVVTRQSILIYEQLSPDTIALSYFDLYNLHVGNQMPVPADTSIAQIRKTLGEWPETTVEEYYMITNPQSVQIQCRTFNTAVCKDGRDNAWKYRLNGSFYWSLWNHEYWFFSQ